MQRKFSKNERETRSRKTPSLLSRDVVGEARDTRLAEGSVQTQEVRAPAVRHAPGFVAPRTHLPDDV